MSNANPFASTLDVLAGLLPEHLLKPRVGIVCGSGLSTLASSLRDVHEVPYSALEGFGKSTGALLQLHSRTLVELSSDPQSRDTKALLPLVWSAKVLVSQW